MSKERKTESVDSRASGYSRGGLSTKLSNRWARFWMRFAGLSWFGRQSMRVAATFAPPHKARGHLARMNPLGFIAPSVTIYHYELKLGRHVFLDERVLLFQRPSGGMLDIGDRVFIYRDTIVETGYGGSLTIGKGASIHPRCQINAYVVPVHIGDDVMLAPGCAIYSYDHGIAPDQPIADQPLTSKGSVVIERGAWLGYGVIVLGGVRIGEGAAIGAGSVVTHDIPAGGIAAGVPARVVKMRSEMEDLQ